MLVEMYRTRPFMPNLSPNHNVAPTQSVIVIRADTDKNECELEFMHWGLIPSWSKTGKMDFATFNAKRKTAATSATFRGPFKSPRRIVPADAFYAWRKLGPGPKPRKQSYAIARANPRIDMMVWFMLRDDTNIGVGWQSGLLTAAGKKKPSFSVFARLPH